MRRIKPRVEWLAPLAGSIDVSSYDLTVGNTVDAVSTQAVFAAASGSLVLDNLAGQLDDVDPGVVPVSCFVNGRRWWTGRVEASRSQRTLGSATERWPMSSPSRHRLAEPLYFTSLALQDVLGTRLSDIAAEWTTRTGVACTVDAPLVRAGNMEHRGSAAFWLVSAAQFCGGWAFERLDGTVLVRSLERTRAAFSAASGVRVLDLGLSPLAESRVRDSGAHAGGEARLTGRRVALSPAGEQDRTAVTVTGSTRTQTVGLTVEAHYLHQIEVRVLDDNGDDVTTDQTITGTVPSATYTDDGLRDDSTLRVDTTITFDADGTYTVVLRARAGRFAPAHEKTIASGSRVNTYEFPSWYGDTQTLFDRTTAVAESWLEYLTGDATVVEAVYPLHQSSVGNLTTLLEAADPGEPAYIDLDRRYPCVVAGVRLTGPDSALPTLTVTGLTVDDPTDIPYPVVGGRPAAPVLPSAPAGDTAPTEPQNLTGVYQTADPQTGRNEGILLDWDPPSAGTNIHYQITRTQPGQVPVLLAADHPTSIYLDTTAGAGEWTYSVSAVNRAGSSLAVQTTVEWGAAADRYWAGTVIDEDPFNGDPGTGTRVHAGFTFYAWWLDCSVQPPVAWTGPPPLTYTDGVLAASTTNFGISRLRIYFAAQSDAPTLPADNAYELEFTTAGARPAASWVHIINTQGQYHGAEADVAGLGSVATDDTLVGLRAA